MATEARVVLVNVDGAFGLLSARTQAAVTPLGPPPTIAIRFVALKDPLTCTRSPRLNNVASAIDVEMTIATHVTMQKLRRQHPKRQQQDIARRLVVTTSTRDVGSKRPDEMYRTMP